MRKICALAVLAPLALSVSAEAALLGVSLQPSPDIFSSFINVGYNAGTDTFSASGFALTINTGTPPAQAITSGTFNITATVDSSGVATGGSLTIGGSFSSFGSPLLTGSLIAMGWDPVGLFDFLFSVTGGSLATPSFYGNPGSVFGVIMNANGGSFSGDWNVNFNNGGQGVSDAAPVPTPAALPMFLAAFCHGRSRRRRS